MMRWHVSEAAKPQVAAFAEANGLPVQFVDTEPWDLRIVANEAGERQESTVNTLVAGGFVKCATAWALAEQHTIPKRVLGALCNELDVRIRECSLGCF